MKKTNNVEFIGFVIILVLTISMQVPQASALYEYNYSAPAYRGINAGAYFQATVLKYDPYPVSPGSWFDVWVQVENLGQDDAKDVRFQLVPEYPFSAADGLIQDFPVFYGVESAYLSGEQRNGNVALLKYRVKTADNAPDGISNLKLIVKTEYLYTPNTETKVLTVLPISIAKTKTDFEVVLQDMSTTGISFAVANTGSNSATAVVASIDKNALMNSTLSTSQILGNIDKGDYTTLSFQGFPRRGINEILMNISYTDSAGVRSYVEKKIPINSGVGGDISSGFGAGGNENFAGRRVGGIAGSAQAAVSSKIFGIPSNYLYPGFSFLLGVAITLFFKRKKKQ